MLSTEQLDKPSHIRKTLHAHPEVSELEYETGMNRTGIPQNEIALLTVGYSSGFSQLINYELLTRLPQDIPRIVTK